MIDGKQCSTSCGVSTSSSWLPKDVRPSTSQNSSPISLFLKIDDERSQRQLTGFRSYRTGLGWQSLVNKDGSELEEQFRHVVQECGKLDPRPADRPAGDLSCRGPRLALHARPELQLPHEGRNRSRRGGAISLVTDLREMYGLLMGEASAGFRIASGQTLTPLPLVSAVIDCLRPNSSDVVLDPACGTGSLLVAAQQSMARDRDSPGSRARVTGADFDPIMCRFATMNYLLSTGLPFDSPPPVQAENSLAEPEKGAPTVIVCNPPFRSTAPLPEGRTDLWARAEHAAQLPPAHRAQPADRRASGGIRSGQHPLRGQEPKPPCAAGSSRSMTCTPCSACPRVSSPAAV